MSSFQTSISRRKWNLTNVRVVLTYCPVTLSLSIDWRKPATESWMKNAICWPQTKWLTGYLSWLMKMEMVSVCNSLGQLKMFHEWFKVSLSQDALMALWSVNVACVHVFIVACVYRKGRFVPAVQNDEFMHSKISPETNYSSSLRGALPGWVHWWSTEGQVGDEDAADGRQPWGLDGRSETQCWLLRLEHGLSICHIHTFFMCDQSCCLLYLLQFICI